MIIEIVMSSSVAIGVARVVLHLPDSGSLKSKRQVISGLLRHELILIDELGFAPLDDTGSQLLFRFVAAAYECRSLGVASHWPFEEWGHFLPVQTTAVSLLDSPPASRGGGGHVW